MSIVVADDSITILNLVALTLRRDGYEPVLANDGAEALAAIREHKPRLVIIDAMMPNGDGFEVCQAVRADSTIEPPYVIMLSAAVREVDRKHAEEVGVDEFITKPFSPIDLRNRVRTLLAETV